MASSSLSPFSESKAPIVVASPDYFISYASGGIHSFIIISKDKKVVASFGLFGDTGAFCESIVCGARLTPDQVGLIRSEYLYFEADSKKTIGDIRLKNIGIKNFSISASLAISLLEMVKSDILKSEPRDGEHVYKPFQEQAENEAKLGADKTRKEEMTYFTPQEKELHIWFRHYPRCFSQKKIVFNAGKFNCHQFAIRILRYAGIHDDVLNSYSLPLPPMPELLPQNLHHFFCSSSTLIAAKPTKSASFPIEFYDTLYNANDLIKGAITLLNNYCTDFWHPNRTHRIEILEAIGYINKNLHLFESIKSITNYIEERLPKYRNMNGCSQKLLDFLNTQSCLNPKDRDSCLSSAKTRKQGENLEKRSLFRCF